MKKLLNTFICILLTSPLAAFDIPIEWTEFGKLQMVHSIHLDQVQVSFRSPYLERKRCLKCDVFYKQVGMQK